MDRKKNTTTPYPAEFREHAVRMVEEHVEDYRSLTAAVVDIAQKLGCSPDSLRVWYKQARRDAGREAGPTSAGKARSQPLERRRRSGSDRWRHDRQLRETMANELEREVRELRQGEEDQETVRGGC